MSKMLNVCFRDIEFQVFSWLATPSVCTTLTGFHSISSGLGLTDLMYFIV